MPTIRFGPGSAIRNHLRAFCILGALAAFAPMHAGAYEKYGKITPGMVISLWLNINKTIPLLTTDSAVAGQIRGLQLIAAPGKTPGDVLEQVLEFHRKLGPLLREKDLRVAETYREAGKAVSPSIVFINSANQLDAILNLVLALNPGDPGYRGNFHRHFLKDKTPSDVFAQAELANRGLELILNQF